MKTINFIGLTLPSASWRTVPSVRQLTNRAYPSTDGSEWEDNFLIYSNLKGPDSIVESGPGLSWRRPTLPLDAVPSALTGLTSLFGMGRGGTPSL